MLLCGMYRQLPDFVDILDSYLNILDGRSLALASPWGLCDNPFVKSMKAKADAGYVVEPLGNQNMEIASDGVTVLNTLSAPFCNFARAACVSIQLAWARRCLQPDASASLRDVAGMLEGNLPMACIMEGGSLHDRIVREVMGVGADGLRQDTDDHRKLRDYNVTPDYALNCVDILASSLWIHFKSYTRCRLLNQHNLHLPEALLLIDDAAIYPANLPVHFLLIGCGKACGFRKVESMVVHFDSHQRGGEATCVAGVARTAFAFLPWLLVGDAYTLEAWYDVYVVHSFSGSCQPWHSGRSRHTTKLARVQQGIRAPLGESRILVID